MQSRCSRTGKIVLGGVIGDEQFSDLGLFSDLAWSAGYNPGGSKDPSFDAEGRLYSRVARALAIQANGGILRGGVDLCSASPRTSWSPGGTSNSALGLRVRRPPPPGGSRHFHLAPSPISGPSTSTGLGPWRSSRMARSWRRGGQRPVTTSLAISRLRAFAWTAWIRPMLTPTERPTTRISVITSPGLSPTDVRTTPGRSRSATPIGTRPSGVESRPTSETAGGDARVAIFRHRPGEDVRVGRPSSASVYWVRFPRHPGWYYAKVKRSLEWNFGVSEGARSPLLRVTK